MTKVKICGVTNLRDARACVYHGADFIGFVFYKKSRRYISAARAKKIIEKLPADIRRVGVFVNEAPEEVIRTARLCRLGYLQFHGDEAPDYLNSFNDFKMIKAFRVRDKLDLKALSSYKVDYFLFDTFSKNSFGGTGRKFDWKLLEALKNIKTPFFVSGGLTVQNVAEMAGFVKPFCVDVSSGVEKAPGKKDHRLVKEFIKVVKSNDK